MSNKKRSNPNAAADLPGAVSVESFTNSPNALEAKRHPAARQQAEDWDKSTNQTNKSRLKNGLAYLKIHALAATVICFLSLGLLGASLKYLEEDARREIARRASGNVGSPDARNAESFLNKINPFLPAALPNPTPPLSKEYIYAGSRMLAVEDANANAAPPADLAVWRPSTGVWWVLGGPGSQQTTHPWGMNGDLPVQGDYDGDGKADFSIYRKVSGQSSQWWILKSSDNTYYQTFFGLYDDKPVPADYDGDGKTDIAVYRAGSWYITLSSNNQFTGQQFGLPTDVPAPADYDGDGKADIAVWRNSNTTFYSLNSTNGALQSPSLGQSSTEPVSGDYDGDGKANYAVKSGNNWVILNHNFTQIQSVAWQLSDDIPVQNDYDGDGKVDIAVWRNSNGTWYIKNSADNSTRVAQWGASGDIPVPAYYRR